MNIKRFFVKNKALMAIFLTIGLLFNASLSSLLLGISAGKNTAQAKDASHAGMVFLQPKLDASSHHITGSINNAKVGDAFWAQDTEKAPEFLSTKTLYAANSWKWTANLLNGGDPGDLGEKNLVDSQNSVKKWEDFSKNNFATGKNEKQTNILVMSFPGWGASDTIDNADAGKNEVKNRLDKDVPQEFVLINSNSAANSAGAVNEELIQEFNRALDVFYARVVNKDTNQGNVTLTKEGLANMVWLVAHGYMPKDKGAIIKYDTNNYTFDTDQLAKGKFEVVNKMKNPENPKQDITVNPWKIDVAGAPILKFKTPDAGEKDEDKIFTYGVAKGYSGGVGDGGTSKYATDVYGITWRDLAINAIATANNPDVKSADSSNTTVVGDQVNSLLYSGFSTALSLLGIQKVDDLVFNEAGNLFKNNTYKTYILIMLPFTVFAIMWYWYIAIDAYRKSTLSYLNIGEAGSVMSSITRVANGLIMTVAFPLLVAVLVYLDQVLVKFALNLHYYLSLLVGSTDASVSTISGFLADTLGSIIVAFMLAWIDIKFTWRYIARTISFGLYFITAPILFAYDAFNNDSRGFLQYGQTAGELWKNIVGVVLQRSMDAFGIALALNLGRLIFGQGILVTILGFLSIEALTNTLLGLLNIRNSTIKGIAETGQSIWKKGVGMGAAFAGAVGAGALGKGVAAMKSGKNLDAENLATKLASTGTAKTNNTSAKNLADIDKEVQTPTTRKSGVKNNATTGNKAKGTGTGTSLDEKLTLLSNTETDPTGKPIKTGTGSADLLGIDNETETSTSGNTGTGTNGSSTGVKDSTSEQPDRNESLWAKATNTVGNIGNADKKRGVFGQAFFNKGIHGDKDTVNGRISQLKDGKDLDPNRFTVTPDGKIKSTSGLFSKQGFVDRAQLKARNATRFAGGVASGLLPSKTLGRSLAAGTFAAISQITPTKFDDVIAGAFAMSNAQDAMTGRSTGALSTISNSLMGRMLGMKRSNFEVDTFKPGSGSPQTQMRGSSGGALGASVQPKGMEFASLNTDQGINSYTSFNSEVSSRNEKEALNSAKELTKYIDSSRLQDGSYSLSREDLVNQVYDTTSGYNQHAANLLDYMDANQYQTMSFDGENVGFKQQLSEVDTFNPNDAGLNAHKQSIVERLNAQGGTEDAEVRDSLTGSVYKYNENGEISQYGNMDRVVNHQDYVANKELISDINKNKDLSQQEKGQLIKDVYSGQRESIIEAGGVQNYIQSQKNPPTEPVNPYKRTPENKILDSGKKFNLKPAEKSLNLTKKAPKINLEQSQKRNISKRFDDLV